jgi:hypothetical protein
LFSILSNCSMTSLLILAYCLAKFFSSRAFFISKIHSWKYSLNYVDKWLTIFVTDVSVYSFIKKKFSFTELLKVRFYCFNFKSEVEITFSSFCILAKIFFFDFVRFSFFCFNYWFLASKISISFCCFWINYVFSLIYLEWIIFYWFYYPSNFL